MPCASSASRADHRPITAFRVASLASALVGTARANAAMPPTTAVRASRPRQRREALAVAVVVLALIVALAGLVVAALIVGLRPSGFLGDVGHGLLDLVGRVAFLVFSLVVVARGGRGAGRGRLSRRVGRGRGERDCDAGSRQERDCDQRRQKSAQAHGRSLLVVV